MPSINIHSKRRHRERKQILKGDRRSTIPLQISFMILRAIDEANKKGQRAYATQISCNLLALISLKSDLSQIEPHHNNYLEIKI